MAKDVKLSLKARTAAIATPAAEPWRVLVVDDDDQVHAMTRILLRDFSFDGRGFEMLSAHSAAQAADLIKAHPHIPVVLLDVVMESPDAGLQLVRHIRETLGNTQIRIILRTGQPGEAPERDVVLAHDINDYKSKSELTAQKLFTALVGAIRAWRGISTIARLNQELSGLNASLEEKVASRTAELEDSRDALARARDRAELALTRETEAKQELRQFLSMVSHEFRTPLAIIDSAAQMLMMRVEKTDTAALPRLETIRGAVHRLVDLIATCLADEQLESGRIVLQERALKIGPLLESAAAHHRAATPGRDLHLNVGKVPPVWGDPGMLALVFNNLVGNALKYSEAGPVELTVRSDHGAIAVDVRDHGIGIPEGDVPRVFERFFRAANTNNIAGSGIGLHMVRQIIDLHGGSIAVDSRLGCGTTVTVRLRRAPRDKEKA
ncbi:MAG: hybrid sensor histidine kinase/response regulator [Rhodospirillaceae bacterium]|nr:hybrid sensor histidine kinase/response regulator [Rhodospirillales bacterium]